MSAAKSTAQMSAASQISDLTGNIEMGCANHQGAEMYLIIPVGGYIKIAYLAR